MNFYIKTVFNNNVIQKIRFGSSNAVIFKPKDYIEREKQSKNSKCGRKYAIDKVVELLGVRNFTAIELVVKNKKLWDVSGNVMNNNYYICKDHHITNDTFIKYTDILAQKDLEEKLTLLKELPFDVNTAAPLLTIPLKSLERFVKLETPYLEARLNTFNRVLDMTPESILKAFVHRPFLRKLNLERLEVNVQILRGEEFLID